MVAAGITALSVYHPKTIRRNGWWRHHAPSFVAALEGRAASQVWEGDGPANPWQAAMAPYLEDVFRGTTARRVMAPGETAHDMEEIVTRRLLDAAGLRPEDIDLVLVSCLFPDQYVLGDAIGLAERVGFSCPCVNVESACGVAVADLGMAAAMVETGRVRRVLIVTACTYSRSADADNPMSLTSGDGAAAMLVSQVPDGYGLRSWKSYTTLESARAFDYAIEPDPVQRYMLKMLPTREAGRALEACSLKYLPLCCGEALRQAGLRPQDLRFAALTTPTAWFADFACRVLGLPADKVVDTYPRTANTGPVLMPQNLYEGARQGRFGPGDDVLLFTLGSMSTSGAAVVRMADLVLAPAPDEGVEEELGPVRAAELPSAAPAPARW
ncbi:hypothetical protein L6R53_09035 [Myxococcota bacterium]|nr:hypothetical protein [Myxococcota bacterium]